MTERTEALFRTFAHEVAAAVLDDPRFRQIVKEMVRQVFVELEAQDRRAAIPSIVRRCHKVGAKVYVNRRGELICWPKKDVDAETLAALEDNRAEITEYLKRANGKPVEAKR